MWSTITRDLKVSFSVPLYFLRSKQETRHTRQGKTRHIRQDKTHKTRQARHKAQDTRDKTRHKARASQAKKEGRLMFFDQLKSEKIFMLFFDQLKRKNNTFQGYIL
jgi:hypothetical protein